MSDEKEIEYLYWVVFRFRDGSGSTEVFRKKPIEYFSDVKELGEWIGKENKLTQCSVVSWELMKGDKRKVIQ